MDEHFNWCEYSIHWLYLSTFLKPRLAEENPSGVNWHHALGEQPDQAIERFIRDGVLRRGSTRERLAHEYTNKELQEMLRDRGKTFSGSKEELVERLVGADLIGMEITAGAINLLQVSDGSRVLVEEYLNNPEGLLARQERESGSTETPLTRDELRRVMKWFLLEGVILGVAGNFAYDMLKKLAEEAGEKLDTPPSGRILTVKVTRNLSLEFCYVPAGNFWMGSSNSDRDARDNEKPQRQVYLDAFYLGRFPVTNIQYQAFIRATGYESPWRRKQGYDDPVRQADHPVRSLYWTDAWAFCDWAAKESGRPIRLLTEAEWEKGARGTDGRIYPWGNRWDSRRCNTLEAGLNNTTPVTRYPDGRSPYGAYDMIGNVWEWSNSLYKSYPYNANDGRENRKAEGPRVVRDGGYWNNKVAARAASRHPLYWYHLLDVGGFRVGLAA